MKTPFTDPHVKALLDVGFIKLIDVIFFALMTAVFVTAVIAYKRDSLTLSMSFALCMSQVTLSGVWVVVLAYRTCYQVIMARSDINTMPDAAAKLALSYKAK